MANVFVLFSIAVLLQLASSVPLTHRSRQYVKRRQTRQNPVTQCDSDCQDNITPPKSIERKHKEQIQNPDHEKSVREEQISFREEELLQVGQAPIVLVAPDDKPDESNHRLSLRYRTARMASPSVLSYLPIADVPLYHTFIHGFDSLKDSVNIENPSFQNPVKRDATDDFMEQLAHDAIMPNILPTMQIPEVRSAGDNQGGVQVVYPEGSRCKGAVPLLFGCSPRVVIGELARRVPSHVSAGAAVPAY